MGINTPKIITTISATLPLEDVIAPTLLNSWVNFDGGYLQAGYFKDGSGRIYLQGLIKSGTVGSAAFNLPVGYRPTNQLLFCSVSYHPANPARVDIASNGNVIIQIPTDNRYVSLDGINFRP